jgi:hypothetical protein
VDNNGGPSRYARPIPPHTGYGSEEDTLKNCFSFDPKPPLKDGAKAILNSGKILRYGARILTPNVRGSLQGGVLLRCSAWSLTDVGTRVV